jgi:hypothetical protein
MTTNEKKFNLKEWFGKLSTAKKVILIGVTGALVYGIFADKETKQDVKQTETTVETAQSEPTQQVADKPKNISIGDTLDGGDWKFCVTQMEEGKTYNAAFNPKDGEKFVTLECFLQNNSDKKFEYSIMFWKLGDQDGFEHGLEMMGDKRPSFSSGDLEPGKKKKGYVTFKCPKEAKNFELHFNPVLSLVNKETYTIKLSK